jgi:hypothetical protein
MADFGFYRPASAISADTAESEIYKDLVKLAVAPCAPQRWQVARSYGEHRYGRDGQC